MAGRITALTGGRAPGGVTYGVRDVLTPGLVDSAVDQVLEGEDEHMKSAIVHLWANDYTSDIAVQLQAAVLHQTSRQKFSAAGKTKVVVRNVLQPGESESLVATHPDCDIRFEYSANADHSYGGTLRRLGSARLIGNIPPQMRYGDFGGNVIDHVENADRECVVVGKVLDGHDPMREVFTRRRLAVIAAEAEKQGGDSVKVAVSKRMARSILAGEGRYHVNKSMQEFSEKLAAGIMVHVYDIPLVDIPKMMERCEMAVLEGTMHFSNRFFYESEGTLPDVGARFTIDRDKDEFRMGFVDSPVLWYEHKWSEFRKYGADQVLHGNSARFSYKVVSRRGDTIDFRVLRVGGGAEPESKQFYAMPAVPMVEVVGYKSADGVAARSSDLERATRLFPRQTWEYMVRHAAVDAAKGVLDYNALVGTYMTITAGDTYNGTTLSLGRIDIADLPLLVVWSAVYALGEIMLLKRGIRTMVDLELDRRVVAEDGLVQLGAKLFVETLGVIGKGPGGFFSGVLRSAVEGARNAFADSILEVRPIATMVAVPGDVLEKARFSGAVGRSLFPRAAGVGQYDSRFAFAEQLSEQLEYDRLMSAVALRVKEAQKADVDKGVLKVDGTSIASNAGDSETLVGADDPPPSWMPVKPEWEKYKIDPHAHTEADRVAAVKEEIAMCLQEAEKLEAFFATIYAKVVRGRNVDVPNLRANSAAWRDADLWWVDNNMITKSALGKTADQFDLGGAYVPAPDVVGVAITYLRPVFESTWSGKDPTGKMVNRTHWYLDGAEYNGWIMTNRELAVFNGRQVVAGLEVALRYSFRFDTGVYMGGPGCGKTTMIVTHHQPADFVMSPLVMSVKDTRLKMAKAKGVTVESLMARIRTNDSLLCEVGKAGKLPFHYPRSDVVRSDEVFNGRYGRACACAALLQAKILVGYGDGRQIKPVVRADVKPVYASYVASRVVERDVVFRCPAQVVACINPHYDNRLRTMKQNDGSVTLVTSLDGIKPKGDYLLLCMNQDGKPLLHKLFPEASTERIKTVHEAQGGEAADVYLFCLIQYKRPRDDPFHLYNVDEYVNVALSRTAMNFTYVNLSPNRDCVVEWIERGREPEAIAMARFVPA